MAEDLAAENRRLAEAVTRQAQMIGVLVSQIVGVRELHAAFPARLGNGTVIGTACSECGEPWPCPTIATLDERGQT